MKKNLEKSVVFDEKYIKYKTLLMKIIFSYVKNYDDCQDVMQDVFYKLLYKSPEFVDEEHEKRWLIATAINLSKDYHKCFWRRNTEGLTDEIAKNQATDKEDVLSCVKSLSNKYKEVILLHYICGYSLKEIAKMLKISESAVKMRLVRAREILKIEMED